MADYLKPLTVGDRMQLADAYNAWSNGNAYLSGDNYRLTEGGKIAPWNKLVKQLFKTSNPSFDRAARLFRDKGEVFVPTYLEGGNVRIIRQPANLFLVEIWVGHTRTGHPISVMGLAANILLDAFRLRYPKHC